MLSRNHQTNVISKGRTSIMSCLLSLLLLDEVCTNSVCRVEKSVVSEIFSNG